jgi:small-conductance mechanosensitive channel
MEVTIESLNSNSDNKIDDIYTQLKCKMNEFISSFINNWDIIEGSDDIYIAFNQKWRLKIAKFFKHIASRYYDVQNIYNLFILKGGV